MLANSHTLLCHPESVRFGKKGTITEHWQTKQHHNAHFLLQLQGHKQEMSYLFSLFDLAMQFTDCEHRTLHPPNSTLCFDSGLFFSSAAARRLCRNMTSPQFLLQQGLWLILHDQSSWLPVMQFCTVNLYSSSILMLFLVLSPCDRQPSCLFHIFQIIWDYFLKLLFHHGK